MLILKVKRGRFVRVGEADVVIDRIQGGYVTLGIEAPRHVKILRGELTPDAPEQPDRDCEMDGK